MALLSFPAAQQAIVAIGRRLDARGWAPATAGNYSVRLDDGGFAVTASGWHKGRLAPEGVLRLDAQGGVVGAGKPSAETQLHLALYRRFPEAGAVLHGHSASAVGYSRAFRDRGEWRFAGHEMLKAFPGIATHDAEVRIPVVDNSQDMAVIEAAIAPALDRPDAPPVYMIRDHGLYGWGKDLDEAERVLEATEWLIAAERAERGFREAV